MDKTLLVVDRIEEGSRLIHSLSHGRLEVSAAFWLYSTDDENWSLHIVSPTIDQIGLRDSYVAIIHAIRALPDAQIEADDVTLLRTNDPLSVAMLEYLRRHPSASLTRVWGTFIGDIFIDQAYIYPKGLNS